MNTSGFSTLVAVLGTLGGVVLGWGLRRFGRTKCVFTDWDLIAVKKTADGMGGLLTEKVGLTPNSPDTPPFEDAYEINMKVDFRLFNGRELPTALSELRIYFLRGGSTLANTGMLDLYSYEENGRQSLLLESINLPSREWVEISASTSHIRWEKDVAGFEAAELRGKYPGSSSEDFREKIPKVMLIPVEKVLSHH